MTRYSILLAALLLLSIRSAAAIGLGELEVDSTLHERFDARIQLVALKPGDAERLVVRLADPEAFERAGVPRPHHLTGLRFETVGTGEGAGHIRITSKDRIREPFLTFIVEVKWPGGKALREYTALMKRP